MRSMYGDTKRVMELAAAFDNRDPDSNDYLEKISGTGQTYERTIWLNLADKYSYICL